MNEYWQRYVAPNSVVRTYVLETNNQHIPLEPTMKNRQLRSSIMNEAMKLFREAASTHQAYWLVSESRYEHMNLLWTNPEWTIDPNAEGPSLLMDMPVYVDDGSQLDTDEHIRLLAHIPRYIDVISPLL